MRNRLKLFQLAEGIQGLAIIDQEEIKIAPARGFRSSRKIKRPVIGFLIYCTEMLNGRYVELAAKDPFESEELRDTFFDNMTANYIIEKFNRGIAGLNVQLAPLPLHPEPVLEIVKDENKDFTQENFDNE